jgi:hypothetical protein
MAPALWQFCPATSARAIRDLGDAHHAGELDCGDTCYDGERHTWEASTLYPSCDASSALLADGMFAGIARPESAATYAVWERHAVTSCIEIDFGQSRSSTGIRYLAAGSDEAVCGDSCNADDGCGTSGTMLVFVADKDKNGPDDFTGPLKGTPLPHSSRVLILHA